MKKNDTEKDKACGFDRIFLAVGSAEQKRIAEALLLSAVKGCASAIQVIPDSSDGKRLGSGGAVLRIFQTLSSETDIEISRILVINCGGLSRRVASYSLCSKALIPVGVDAAGEIQTCFSHILKNAMLVSTRMNPGVLLCCADILLEMSSFSETLSSDASFCVKAPASVGTHHGVMVSDAGGTLMSYYQKAARQDLLSCAADGQQNVNVETGWTYFSASTVSALAGAAAAYTEKTGELPPSNLYEDVIPLFASHADLDNYIHTDKYGLRPFLAARICGKTMHVYCLQQPFLHFGTLPEILSNVVLSDPCNEIFSFNSMIGAHSSIGKGTLLDHVRLEGRSVIGERCMLSDIDLRDVTVPAGTMVFGLRLRDGRFVSVVSEIEKGPNCAAQTADALWNTAFYPANSFSESLHDYLTPSDTKNGMLLSACFSQADTSAFLERRRYLEDCLRTEQSTNVQYTRFRERLLSLYFNENDTVLRLNCERDSAEIHLPVRINLSGTWTDCMPYCIENGGLVVNAAVTVDGIKPIIVRAQRIREKRIEFVNGENPARISVYDPCSDVSDYAEFGLHHAVIQTLGINRNTELADGIRLTVQVSGLVRGSGLGISSILLYGSFFVLGELLGRTFSEQELLEKTFVAEQLMRTGGGWQDQGAIVGHGIKAVSAAPGLPQRISVTPVETPPMFLRALSERLLLIDTGQRHFGRFIVSDVMNRYLSSETADVFREIEEINQPMLQSLRHGDLMQFVETVNAHSACLERLSPLIYGEELRSLREKCLRFTDACCICGAGGGGYLWAIRKEGISFAQIREAIHTEIRNADIF